MTQAKVPMIRKRDGRLVRFERERIAKAIEKAISATGSGDGAVAQHLADEVTRRVLQRAEGFVPSVEEIQDAVERVLIENRMADVAKAYILYRQRRAEIREAKAFLDVKDELKLSVNAANVLRTRYLRRDDRGRVVETPAQMFERVARAISKVELRYTSRSDAATKKAEFLRVLKGLYFLPNSPTLMNAGTRLGQLAACFVLPVEDSMKSIFTAVRNMALIHQSGGGTGFSFSRLRPAGDIVQSTKGVASGPVSFMRIFDVATDVVKQGGRRRGANMGVLAVDHPDILDFILAKEREGTFSNFNLSVAVTDEFLSKVEKDEDFDLVNPRTGESMRRIRARDIFNTMVSTAWRTGDPGIIFIDEVNRHNPTPALGRIESTNPCGEVPLLPYESCTLGSINLSKMVEKGEVNWDLLARLSRLGVHFLDDVLDANKYPVRLTAKMARTNRKIGLGVMGFAEMLIRLGIPYDSGEAIKYAERVMGLISEEGRKASRELAEERGAFPSFDSSIWAGGPPLRNATITSIAPTGTISIIAGTSSGIEPLFAVAFVRRVLNTELVEVNPIFEEMGREEGFYTRELIGRIAKTGSLQGVPGVPDRIRRLFVTAFEIEPEWHVKMQAAFQKYVDNSVSKTVNLPHDASMEDVRTIFNTAYRLKCKGVTVYRYGSRSEQVLYTGTEAAVADSEYSGGCPSGECSF